MVKRLSDLTEVVSLEIVPQSFSKDGNLLFAHRLTTSLSYQGSSFVDELCRLHTWNRADVVSIGGGCYGPVVENGRLKAASQLNAELLKLPLFTSLMKDYVSVGGYMLIKKGSPIFGRLFSAVPKVADAAGYLSRFQASLVPDGFFPGVKAVVREPKIDGKPLQSDGASWGWNINHPMWKELRARHGEVPFQFTALGGCSRKAYSCRLKGNLQILPAILLPTW
jgi:hypothetical protein